MQCAGSGRKLCGERCFNICERFGSALGSSIVLITMTLALCKWPNTMAEVRCTRWWALAWPKRLVADALCKECRHTEMQHASCWLWEQAVSWAFFPHLRALTHSHTSCRAFPVWAPPQTPTLPLPLPRRLPCLPLPLPRLPLPLLPPLRPLLGMIFKKDARAAGLWQEAHRSLAMMTCHHATSWVVTPNLTYMLVPVHVYIHIDTYVYMAPRGHQKQTVRTKKTVPHFWAQIWYPKREPKKT